MIEIAICLFIWNCFLTPLWVNIVVSCLLALSLSYKLFLFATKFFELGKEEDNNEFKR